jgi:ABC-type multidrug transport system fused ATPase/permease subunit
LKDVHTKPPTLSTSKYVHTNVHVQVIAHRQSTIQRANSVAVIKDGVIVESGQYDQLIANKESELAALMRGGVLAAA